MMANENSKINEDIYKRKRSISSKIGNNLNDENVTSKGIKSRHRKMASSYFLGSYISGDELIKFAQEYEGISLDNKINKTKNDTNVNNNGITDNNNLIVKNINEKNDINNLRNLLLKNNINDNKNDINNEKNNPVANASFYSYSIEDEDNKKINENKNIENGSAAIVRGDTVDESLTNNAETKSN